MAQIWSVDRRAGRSQDETSAPARTPLSQTLGRTRYVVLLAVIAVMLVAITLFLMGTIQAFVGVWDAWRRFAESRFGLAEADVSVNLTVKFLEIVSTMLKAVVFYIIGVGLYSLFIAPLNVTVALGVETLSDLESKVVSVVIVIMGITFLEHFIAWEEPLQTLQFGGALALVVGALVFFQTYSHRAKEDQKEHNPDAQKRAQRALTQNEGEEHTITPAEVSGSARDDEK